MSKSTYIFLCVIVIVFWSGTSWQPFQTSWGKSHSKPAVSGHATGHWIPTISPWCYSLQWSARYSYPTLHDYYSRPSSLQFTPRVYVAFGVGYDHPSIRPYDLCCWQSNRINNGNYTVDGPAKSCTKRMVETQTK